MASLNVRHVDEITLASFEDGRIIEDSSINSLGKELSGLLGNKANSRIILNFSNVMFMSSAMVGKLILFGKQCKAADVPLRMCNINDSVGEVFKLMQLGKIFKIDKDVATSKKKIMKKSWLESLS